MRGHPAPIRPKRGTAAQPSRGPARCEGIADHERKAKPAQLMPVLEILAPDTGTPRLSRGGKNLRVVNRVAGTCRQHAGLRLDTGGEGYHLAQRGHGPR